MLMQSGMLFARKFDDSLDASVIKRISDSVKPGQRKRQGH
jgi:hypothetical protein